MQETASTAPVEAPNGGGDDGYVFPVDGIKPGSTVQTHWDSGETGGTDIFAPAGTPIRSCGAGTVTGSGYDPTGGYYVMVRGDDGRDYYYAHMQGEPGVAAGQRVEGGQQIGAVGNTGNAVNTDPHLHIGIGDGIQTGSGPQGGCGIGFNAVEFLQQQLDQG